MGRKVMIDEDMLRKLLEGKVRLVKDKKLRYGKYRIVRRYVLKE